MLAPACQELLHFIMGAEKMKVESTRREKFKDEPRFQAGARLEKGGANLSQSESGMKMGLPERTGDLINDSADYFSLWLG
jgi:hypothetical protein